MTSPVQSPGYAQMMGTNAGRYPAVDHGLPPLGRLNGRPGPRHSSERFSNGRRFREVIGSIILSDDIEDLAEIPYTAQVHANGAGDPSRPLVFAFGGGPMFSPLILNYSLMGVYGVATLVDRGYGPALRTGNPTAPTVDVADVVFMESTETGPKGDGPDGSHVFPGIDRRLFWGVERDAQATATAIEQAYYQFYGRDRPLVLAVSSYKTFPVAEVVEILGKRGIKVDGIVFICGHYDYAMQNYEQSDDPLPFATALPQLALTNAFHQKRRFDVRRLHREVDAWAMGPYLSAIRSSVGSSERRDAADRMSKYISPNPTSGPFNADAILKLGLRVDPVQYAKHYFDDQREMSLVDLRYVDPPPPTVQHDVLFDQWGGRPESTYEAWRDERHVDPLFREVLPYFERIWRAWKVEAVNERVRRARETNPRIVDYQPDVEDRVDPRWGLVRPGPDPNDTGFVTHRPLYGSWEFKGRYADRRLHDVIADLVQKRPDIRIMHLGGYFDAVTPPTRARLFWHALKKQGLVDVHESKAGDPFKKNRGRPDVDLRFYEAGHIMGWWNDAKWSVGLDLQRFFKSFALGRDLTGPKQGLYLGNYLGPVKSAPSPSLFSERG